MNLETFLNIFATAGEPLRIVINEGSGLTNCLGQFDTLDEASILAKQLKEQKKRYSIQGDPLSGYRVMGEK